MCVQFAPKGDVLCVRSVNVAVSDYLDGSHV